MAATPSGPFNSSDAMNWEAKIKELVGSAGDVFRQDKLPKITPSRSITKLKEALTKKHMNDNGMSFNNPAHDQYKQLVLKYIQKNGICNRNPDIEVINGAFIEQSQLIDYKPSDQMADSDDDY